jgi:indole-3-acetate monooxygenase
VIRQHAPSLLETVRSLEPIIAAHRDEAERTRQLSRPVFEALADAGLFKLFVPQKLGGFESDLTTFLRVVEAVSRVDSAAGWCLSNGAVHGRMAGFLPEDEARVIFGHPHATVAGAATPTGRAMVAPGGFRVTGRWAYGSGITHSDWVYANAVVHEGERPRPADDGANEIRTLLAPIAECEIVDTWHVGGLRGTGSFDFVINDVFVPEERTFFAFAFRPAPVWSGTLYALPLFSVYPLSIAAVPLGLARAAIEVITELAEAKTPTGSPSLLRERSSVQSDLARAEALVRAARALLLEVAEELWETTERTGETPMKLRALVRLASAHAAVSSVQAMDLMYTAGGATSLREENRIERLFRDVHAAAQHLAVIPHNFELAGRVLLSLNPGTLRF